MFAFQNAGAISVADIVGLTGLFLTVSGLIFAGIQLRQNNVARRAEILLSVIDRYLGNEAQREFFYKLDYGKFTFDPSNFGTGHPDETALDTILYDLEVVGHMLRLGAISKGEVQVLVFEVHRVMMNKEVQEYLRWLDEEYRHIGLSAVPFRNARYLSDRLVGTRLSSN